MIRHCFSAQLRTSAENPLWIFSNQGRSEMRRQHHQSRRCGLPGNRAWYATVVVTRLSFAMPGCSRCRPHRRVVERPVVLRKIKEAICKCHVVSAVRQRCQRCCLLGSPAVLTAVQEPPKALAQYSCPGVGAVQNPSAIQHAFCTCRCTAMEEGTNGLKEVSHGSEGRAGIGRWPPNNNPVQSGDVVPRI